MRMTDIPPALIILLGALLAPLLGGRARWLALLLPGLAAGLAWWAISAQDSTVVSLAGLVLNPVHVHAPTAAFATVMCVMLAGGLLYGMRTLSRWELAGAFVNAGGALGVLFAGDMITFFVFWEIMTLGATALIWAGGQSGSERAGLRYFAMHALGGILLMIGIALVISQRMAAGDPGVLELRLMAIPGFGLSSLGPWLMLAGMAVNAAAPPFSPWLPDAYPEGSPAGTVMLSAFTTKTAVFALMVVFAGAEVLIYVGLFMALYGVIYGILENDMRRLLCYSLVNQVGFMLVGIGVGTKLALDGASAHAFAHIIYKALLLMATGAVLLQTGRRKLNQLGGLWRSMPLTMACCVIGGLSISAFPLTTGFVSKSMVVEAMQLESARMAGEGVPHSYMIIAWFLFQLATAGVFLDACVKLTWFVFLQKDSGLRPAEPPGNMRAAMLAFAAICIVLGMFPGSLYQLLPYPAEALAYQPGLYSMAHVMGMLGLLGFAGLAFFVLLPLLKRTESITLDIDWVWRRFLPCVWNEVVMPIVRGLDSAQKLVLEKLPGKGIGGEPRSALSKLGAEWAVSVPVFLITGMLVVYLVVYFVLTP